MEKREHDFTTKEGTVNAILFECDQHDLSSLEQKAYVLATVEHETAGTFKPVKEAYWLSEGWRKRNLRYYPYYGRGFVQITWDYNYKKFSDILGYNFVKDPDRVMDPNVSLFILVYGFKHGSFTGKKLEDYVFPHHTDFVKARKCINGLDKAQYIADLANEWLVELKK